MFLIYATFNLPKYQDKDNISFKIFQLEIYSNYGLRLKKKKMNMFLNKKNDMETIPRKTNLGGLARRLVVDQLLDEIQVIKSLEKAKSAKNSLSDLSY